MRPFSGKQAKIYIVYCEGTIEKNFPHRVRDLVGKAW